MSGEAIETLALLHFDGDINDEMGNQWGFIGTGYSFTDEKPGFLGNSCLKMNGSTRMECTSPAFAFGLADFTVEYRLWSVRYAGISSVGTGGISLGFSENFFGRSGSPKYIAGGHYAKNPVPIPKGEWVHVAYVRQGDNGYFFINGKLKVTDTGIGQQNLTSNIFALNTKYVGSQYDSGEAYYDEVRISRGARWTADFTPPVPDGDQPPTDTVDMKLHVLLKIDQTVDLTGYMHPVGANPPVLVWSSEDAAIASVDQNGKVTGGAVGKTRIFVQTQDGSWSAFARIKVIGESEDELLLSVLLEVGESCVLFPEFDPEEAETAVLWSSSDAAIATVNPIGLVTGVAPGLVTITARTADNKLTDAMYVTVIADKVQG